MIICDNCGAEYDDNLERCPYCGGDNFGKSAQMHEDAIHEFEREKKQWEEMPDKVAKKGMSIVAKAVLIFFACVLAVSALFFISSTISNRISYGKKTARLNKLETMFQEEDYSGIYHYMKEMDDRYKSDYNKYIKVYTMQECIERYMYDEDEQQVQWMIDSNDPKNLTNVSYLVWILAECQESEDEYYKYNEEDMVNPYREFCYPYLAEPYGLPEDETKTYLAETGGVSDDNKEEVIAELQKMAYDHFKEKQR